MRYVARLIEQELLKASRRFPAVILTGPRRAGETTLLRHAFSVTDYRLLEDAAVVRVVARRPLRS